MRSTNTVGAAPNTALIDGCCTMSDKAEIAKSFLSHNSRDKPAVEVIQGLLERGDLQRRQRPIPCWFDKDDLRSKGTWMSQLEDAMATCGSAVVFYGPDGHGPIHSEHNSTNANMLSTG